MISAEHYQLILPRKEIPSQTNARNEASIFLLRIHCSSAHRSPHGAATPSTSRVQRLPNTTLHLSFLLNRVAPSLFRHRLYRIFDFCGAGSRGLPGRTPGWPPLVNSTPSNSTRSSKHWECRLTPRAWLPIVSSPSLWRLYRG